MRVGEYQELEIERETQNGLYLGDEDDEVLLPKKEVPERWRIGQTLRVFILTDSENRLIATLKNPRVTIGEFAPLQVVAETKVGAFLDWGLDKDLFCPFKEQRVPMREGETHVVTPFLDGRTGRVVCTSKLDRFLEHEAQDLRPAQPIQIMVYENTRRFSSVIINGHIKGMLFEDERVEDLAIGEVRNAFVKQIRDEDRRIAVSLRPQGYRAIIGERDRIMEALQANGGTLPISDKSTPEEIHAKVGLSKAAFKKLIGSLYKEGKIVIEPDSIRLKS